MANKRKLKKYIRYVCGDIATDMLVASYTDSRISNENVERIINDIAALQEASLDRCSFGFDHCCRDFANRAEYRRAYSEYKRKAFRKLRADFNESLLSIVKAMNEALPAEVKEENKKALAE